MDSLTKLSPRQREIYDSLCECSQTETARRLKITRFRVGEQRKNIEKKLYKKDNQMLPRPQMKVNYMGELRKAKGLLRTEVAKKIGVSYNDLIRAETTKYRLSPQALIKFCRIMKIKKRELAECIKD